MVFCLFVMALPIAGISQVTAEVARGLVYHDVNKNGVRDEGEPGVAGVAVSNQREIVETDAEGRWELPHDDDTIFFVIKPRGWMTPVNEEQLPQFYYIHKPEGSPPNFRFKGVDPTGPLPASIDFPLHKANEPDQFKAIFFADPQASSVEHLEFIKHDVLTELIGTDARFGVTLGDILGDQLDLYPKSNADVALIGIPWFNVIGNHDLNFDSPDDADSDETFHRFFGPNYYSFDYGPVHFIVLDNIDWAYSPTDGHRRARRGYRGGLYEEQFDFVTNDLALVPEEKLVCLLMHIPLTTMHDHAKLFRLIEERPYTMSISGHTHWHAHQYLDADDGWRGKTPHHHIVNVTVSGTWWKGIKGETGIPHTMMRDGAPNGYSIITFDGVTHTLDFKAARRSADYQLNVFAPDEVAAADAGATEIHVNVFNGSEKSEVKMRMGEDSEWILLHQVPEEDPYYATVRKREMELDPENKRQLNAPVSSAHLWKGSLPAGLSIGAYVIQVEATDAYGRPHRAKRVIRVVE
ncbi:MAG: calcineurin-like phosphoesterase family protein [Verrucomicrobiota bacterium]